MIAPPTLQYGILRALIGDLGVTVKLTKSMVDKIKYEKADGKKDIRWDDELPGFGLRVYPSGKKSFVLSYSHKGRKRLMVLGPYGVLTPLLAKEKALRELLAINEGKDPLYDRKRQVQGHTVGDLCHRFLNQHSKVHKKSWREDERRINSYLLPKWRSFQVASITRTDVATLHQEVGKKSRYEANRTLSLVATMFRFATEWGYLELNHPNPAKGIRKFKELSRDRWITPEEMPRLAAAIDEEPNTYVRSAIWMYLLTGLRKTELLGAKWSDINWNTKELKIEETKNGSRHYIPLSEPALALLRNIPQEKGNPFIIVGKVAGKALVNISKPWLRIRKRAGVEDIRIHDLRRTTGSWLAQKGNSIHMIARVLNHKSQNTTKTYARFGQNHVREALEEHGRAISEYMPDVTNTEKSEAEILNMKRKAY